MDNAFIWGSHLEYKWHPPCSISFHMLGASTFSQTSFTMTFIIERLNNFLNRGDKERDAAKEHKVVLEGLAKSFIKQSAQQSRMKGGDKYNQRELQENLRRVNPEDLRKIGDAILGIMDKPEGNKEGRPTRHGHRTNRNRDSPRTKPPRRGSGESRTATDKHYDSTDRGRRRHRQSRSDYDRLGRFGVTDDHYTCKQQTHRNGPPLPTTTTTTQWHSSAKAPPTPRQSPHATPHTSPKTERRQEDLEEDYLAYPVEAAPARSEKAPSPAPSSDEQRRPQKSPRQELDLRKLRDELEELANTLTYLNSRNPDHENCEFYEEFVSEASRLQLAIGSTLGQIRRAEETSGTSGEEEGGSSRRRHHRNEISHVFI